MATVNSDQGEPDLPKIFVAYIQHYFEMATSKKGSKGRRYQISSNVTKGRKQKREYQDEKRDYDSIEPLKNVDIISVMVMAI